MWGVLSDGDSLPHFPLGSVDAGPLSHGNKDRPYRGAAYGEERPTFMQPLTFGNFCRQWQSLALYSSLLLRSINVLLVPDETSLAAETSNGRHVHQLLGVCIN